MLYSDKHSSISFQSAKKKVIKTITKKNTKKLCKLFHHLKTICQKSNVWCDKQIHTNIYVYVCVCMYVYVFVCMYVCCRNLLKCDLSKWIKWLTRVRQSKPVTTISGFRSIGGRKNQPTTNTPPSPPLLDKRKCYKSQ